MNKWKNIGKFAPNENGRNYAKMMRLKAAAAQYSFLRKKNKSGERWNLIESFFMQLTAFILLGRFPIMWLKYFILTFQRASIKPEKARKYIKF